MRISENHFVYKIPKYYYGNATTIATISPVQNLSFILYTKNPSPRSSPISARVKEKLRAHFVF